MRLTLFQIFASASAIAIMLLFSFSDESLLWSAIQNAGHFLIFGALTFCYLALINPGSLRHPRTHAVVILALLCLGGFIELAQNFLPDRNASWNDMFLDAAGVLVGYLIFVVKRYFSALPMAISIGLIVCALTITLLSTHPALKLSVYHLWKSGPPAIVSFSDPFVISTISVTGNANVSLEKIRVSENVRSKRRLRMDLANEIYSGVIFHDTTKRWNSAGNLEFALYNPSDESREISLRIHDRLHNNEYHDRYNKTLLVNPGANAYRISTAEIMSLNNKGKNKRRLDMQKIHEIQLFSISSKPYSIFLSDLTLSR